VIASAVEEAFTAQRPRLLGLAYRITGSVADAEDVLQEAWLRAETTDTSNIADPTGWLVTVISRLALDELKRAHRRREEYVGQWLPEPVPTKGVGTDPADTVELAETLTFAYLQLLEALSPAERVALLLADVFDMPYAAIAKVLDRSAASCRQLASRARRRLRDTKPVDVTRTDFPFDPTPFIAALTAGDMQGLMNVLAPDVVLYSDGGEFVRAARRPVVGRQRVGRLIANLAQRYDFSEIHLEPRTVNHSPGAVMKIGDDLIGIVAVDFDDDKITSLWILVNPDKFTAFGQPTELV
jgi:RNA polymerase sigma-70 factor, ECF subfamily